MSDPFDKVRDAWGNPLRPRNFGDAWLAERVIEAAAEGEGPWLKAGLDSSFTALECRDLGIHIEHCGELGMVLKTFSIYTQIPIDRTMAVTDKEQNYLRSIGANPAFVDALAGTDGKRVLRARVKWLADHVITRRWRNDFNEAERIGMLEELKYFGADAKPAIPLLIELGLESSALQFVAVETLLAIEPDEFSRFYYLGQMCGVGEKGERGLITALSGPEPMEVSCAARALGGIGEAAKNAVPALIELTKNQKGTDLEQRAFSALARIGKAAAPAVPLIMQRYEELRHPLKEYEFRVNLIYHLGQIAEPSPQVLNFLEKIVRRNYAWGFDREGRAAIHVLKEMGRESLPLLVRSAAVGVSHSLVKHLGEAIKESKIGRDDISPLLVALQKYWPEDSQKPKTFDVNDRQPYLLAIWELGSVALDELEEILLRENDEDIRVMAVRVLKTFFNGPVRVAPLMVRLLEDRNPKIRKRIAVFWGERGKSAKDALPLLVAIRSNRDETESCRRAAAEAIAKIESEVL